LVLGAKPEYFDKGCFEFFYIEAKMMGECFGTFFNQKSQTTPLWIRP